MSSIPGYTLEQYVMWELNLIVDENTSANSSLEIFEAMGGQSGRKRITAEQFAPILERFEPYREQVENRLLDFDEECQSWRDYAGYAFDIYPEGFEAGLKELLDKIQTEEKQDECKSCDAQCSNA